MDKSNLRDIIVNVGLELRDEYLLNPQDHRDSETFKKALKIVESVEVQHFKIPEFLSSRVAEGQLHL
jgi:hypothetical protein